MEKKPNITPISNDSSKSSNSRFVWSEKAKTIARKVGDSIREAEADEIRRLNLNTK